MVTFPFTSVNRRGGRVATIGVLLLAAFVLGGVSFLRAGSIISLTNGSEVDGKLSVAGTAIHADAESTPPDTALTDVLESRFDDAPFSLNVFFTGKGNQLPPNWVAQDIGQVATPGSATVQDGTFTLTGSGSTDKKIKAGSEHLFFCGVPWTGNGQFTVRLASMDTHSPEMQAGVMFRDSLDPVAAMCAAAMNNQGQIRMPFRHETGKDDWGTNSTGDVPIWLRFSRYGNTIYTSDSTDGNTWSVTAEYPFKVLTNPLVGLMAFCPIDKHDKGAGQAVFDQVSLTPLPSSAQILPAGVVLQGGSVLAGKFSRVDFDPSAADDNGELVRGEKRMPISRSLIAAVITLPMERSQLADLGSKPGLLMRNGDTMDGDVAQVSDQQVSISSVLLGITNYKSNEVRACFVHPLQMQPAALEVRLKDGSIINATAITGDADEVVITDVSGLTIQADQAEVAQVRAGTSLVQNLAQLDWKAATPDAAPAPAPNPASAANPAAPANPAPPPAPPLVQSWLGNDQEQILETGMGTEIEFPLPGKFRAFGVQIALASDSSPNATATIRILADGREVAKSPPFRAGDPPHFVELNLLNPTHVTLQADSMFSGTKILYIDPVAIRN